MQKIFFLTVLFLGVADFSFAQPKCNCSSFTDKMRIEFENDISTGKFDEAYAIAEIQIKSTDPCCHAIGYTLEALIFNGKSKPAESLASALKAQEILHKFFNVYASVESNRIIGYYYHKTGNADSATLFYLKGLKIATDAEEQYLISRICTSISILYSNRKQEQKGLEYQKRGVDAALLSRDTNTIADAYSRLVTSYGRVYDDTENEIYVDSAEAVAQTALIYAKAAGNGNLIMRNYLSVEKFAIVRKQFFKALMYSDTLQSMIDDKTNLQIRISFNIDRGVALTGLKRYDEAIENLNEAYKLAKQTKNVYQERMMNDRLYEVYKAKDDPSHALSYLEKFRVLNDSLIDKENSDAINELEAKYNKLQDQQTIKDLARKKQLYLLLAIAGLLAATSIAFFLRQQSLKHKKNILETEQRLNRARMNPHFFFNALSALQKFALKENDGQAMASNLSKFSNIMRETLESTYKEYVTIEQEMEFLNEYLEVQKIRFPKAFTYSVTADKALETDDTLIPAMIIQPFVENSIEHGFAGIDYPGNIRIHFANDKKEVKIEITDNGKGLSVLPKENNEHISRASQIIKDRIYLLNIKLKTKAGFSIDNDSDGKGVVVKIHLPLLYKSGATGNQ
jgi:tetratricopeptide (TPR) repeat protein/anti-sigma regulatory factor (Ser/Thr protein kinase)